MLSSDIKYAVDSYFLLVLKNVMLLPSSPMASYDYCHYNSRFPMSNVSFCSDFKTFPFTVAFRSLIMSWCEFFCIHLICGAQLLKFVGLCFLPNLGCLQTLCLQILSAQPSFSSSMGLDDMNISFCYCPTDLYGSLHFFFQAIFSLWLRVGRFLICPLVH